MPSPICEISCPDRRVEIAGQEQRTILTEMLSAFSILGRVRQGRSGLALLASTVSSQYSPLVHRHLTNFRNGGDDGNARFH